ncbi:MAG: glycosyltransferase family 39 protein, partial [candidate division KSB1 bacterium]
MTNPRTSFGQKLFLYLIPAILFLSATLPNLRLPGLQYDELYYAPPAAALLKQQYDTDYVKIDPAVVHILGQPLPVMFNYYTSFLRTYLTLPVFAWWGINVATVRGSSIVLGLLALMFFIAFTRRLTNRSPIAFMSGLLLALDASFTAYTHNDYVAVSLMMALKGAGLWALLRWWQEDERRWLYLGAFAFGLGISDRASFLWLPLTLAPALVLMYGKAAWRELAQRLAQRKAWLLAALAFALGAAPFLAFNLATRGGTFSPMTNSFSNTASGANNLDLLGNLYLRVQMLVEVLNGGYLDHFVGGEKSYQTSSWNFSGSPLSWLVPLAVAYFVAKAAIRLLSRLPVKRSLVFLLVMLLGLLFVVAGGIVLEG